jgi:hypothetical protein
VPSIASLEVAEQLSRRHLQCSRQLKMTGNCRHVLPAFDEAEVISGDSGPLGERFLAQTALFSPSNCSRERGVTFALQIVSKTIDITTLR